MWPYLHCRPMDVRIKTLTEAVQTLTTITREMSEKLETAEKDRKADSKKLYGRKMISYPKITESYSIGLDS